MWGTLDMIGYGIEYLEDLKKTEAQADYNYQPISVERDPVSLAQKGSRKLPVNTVENALLVQVGKPSWANWRRYGVLYGPDDEEEPKALSSHFDGCKRGENLISTQHPYQKSAIFYRDFFHNFVPPGSLVIDAFAGSCMTLYAAVSRGCSLICLEKDTNPVTNNNVNSFELVCRDVMLISNPRSQKRWKS
jgi:hypothetical protein